MYTKKGISMITSELWFYGCFFFFLLYDYSLFFLQCTQFAIVMFKNTQTVVLIFKKKKGEG